MLPTVGGASIANDVLLTSAHRYATPIIALPLTKYSYGKNVDLGHNHADTSLSMSQTANKNSPQNSNSCCRKLDRPRTKLLT